MRIQEIAAKSVLTRTNLPVSDYAANPYVGCAHACRYCYASFMRRFTRHAEAWGAFVDVKAWPPLRDARHYSGRAVFLGSVTDPYQPAEATYQRTRALLQQLQGSGVRLTIQTKSDLVLRDVDLLATLPEVRVGFSINTLDEAFRQDMDKAVSIARRLAAMQQLHAAGIRTTCFISPIFPGLTDVPAIIARVRAQCQLIWLENLQLRGSFKADILRYIRARQPQLAPLYAALYTRGDRHYWAALDARLRAYAAAQGLDYVRNDDSMRQPFSAPPVLVNFFYHEQIKKSAQRPASPQAQERA